VIITQSPISLDEFLKNHAVAPDCGASAHFTGIVRNHHKGRAVKKLFYECYQPMAEKVIRKITDEVKNEWGVEKVDVVHRMGELVVGDIAVAIAVSSHHRDEAFSACRAMVDRIKHEVPIWKKEFYQDGTCDWVFCSHETVAVS